MHALICTHLFAGLFSLANVLAHTIKLLHEHLHLLLLVAELAREPLLVRAQLGHALVQFGELLHGQLPLLVSVFQLLGLRLQALQSLHQLLGIQTKYTLRKEIRKEREEEKKKEDRRAR